MGLPHRLHVRAMGHRAVCGGVLVGGLLDILEVEDVVEAGSVGE